MLVYTIPVGKNIDKIKYYPCLWRVDALSYENTVSCIEDYLGKMTIRERVFHGDLPSIIENTGQFICSKRPLLM